jgi:hypothetical protein
MARVQLAVAYTGLRDQEAGAAGFDPLTVGSTRFDHKAYYPGAYQLQLRITGDRTTGWLLDSQLVGHQDAEVAHAHRHPRRRPVPRAACRPVGKRPYDRPHASSAIAVVVQRGGRCRATTAASALLLTHHLGSSWLRSSEANAHANNRRTEYMAAQTDEKNRPMHVTAGEATTHAPVTVAVGSVPEGKVQDFVTVQGHVAALGLA